MWLKYSFPLVAQILVPTWLKYSLTFTIEQELGVALDWRELPEKKASRIMLTRQVDFDNRSAWNAQFDWMMEMSLKFKKVFKKYL